MFFLSCFVFLKLIYMYKFHTINWISTILVSCELACNEIDRFYSENLYCISSFSAWEQRVKKGIKICRNCTCPKFFFFFERVKILNWNLILTVNTACCGKRSTPVQTWLSLPPHAVSTIHSETSTLIWLHSPTHQVCHGQVWL